MPTDNPKISLYVPQKIYDRFKEFQEEKKLSMSQTGILILAEYFGEEETIKEITEGTTIGGVTLARFEELEKKVKELEQKVNQTSTTSKLPSGGANPKNVIEDEFTVAEKAEHQKTNSSLLEENIINKSESQLNLLGEPQSIEPFTAKLLGMRFGMGKTAVPSYKSKNSLEKFQRWTKEKDPDDIVWISNPKGRGYVPKEELSSELLKLLQKWVKENS